MDWAQAFKIANTAALLSWILLLFLPRYPRLVQGLRYGMIAALSLAYSLVIAFNFFKVEGGGFDSLESVKILFSSDAVIFAGWLHYLAFDLFVGLWIAETADRLGLHRVWQIPILFATFMFGPFGLLLFYGIFGTKQWRRNTVAAEKTGG
jgi:hypothetical protein